jgi:hypothetical protein
MSSWVWGFQDSRTCEAALSSSPFTLWLTHFADFVSFCFAGSDVTFVHFLLSSSDVSWASWHCWLCGCRYMAWPGLDHEKVGYKFQQKKNSKPHQKFKVPRIWTTILFTLWEVEAQNQSGGLPLREKNQPTVKQFLTPLTPAPRPAAIFCQPHGTIVGSSWSAKRKQPGAQKCTEETLREAQHVAGGTGHGRARCGELRGRPGTGTEWDRVPNPQVA